MNDELEHYGAIGAALSQGAPRSEEEAAVLVEEKKSVISKNAATAEEKRACAQFYKQKKRQRRPSAVSLLSQVCLKWPTTSAAKPMRLYYKLPWH